MDTSKTYIKMRLAAIPDLKMGEPPHITIGQPIRYMDVQNNVWADKRCNFYYSTENDAVQLERQDQLQEMVHSDWISTLEKFALWAFCPSHIAGEIYYGMGISHNVFTMEQLWLAFVMKEKYDKIWDGNEWVKLPSDNYLQEAAEYLDNAPVPEDLTASG